MFHYQLYDENERIALDTEENDLSLFDSRHNVLLKKRFENPEADVNIFHITYYSKKEGIVPSMFPHFESRTLKKSGADQKFHVFEVLSLYTIEKVLYNHHFHVAVEWL